jgi:hypothetical protein
MHPQAFLFISCFAILLLGFAHYCQFRFDTHASRRAAFYFAERTGRSTFWAWIRPTFTLRASVSR